MGKTTIRQKIVTGDILLIFYSVDINCRDDTYSLKKNCQHNAKEYDFKAYELTLSMDSSTHHTMK